MPGTSARIWRTKSSRLSRSLRGGPSTTLRVDSATEAISTIDGLEIATPRELGARNDKGLPQNLVARTFSEKMEESLPFMGPAGRHRK